MNNRAYNFNPLLVKQSGMLTFSGDPMNPVPPSADLLAQVKKFAGIESDTVNTKQLAVVTFLYLFLSISATHKWDNILSLYVFLNPSVIFD